MKVEQPAVEEEKQTREERFVFFSDDDFKEKSQNRNFRLNSFYPSLYLGVIFGVKNKIKLNFELFLII